MAGHGGMQTDIIAAVEGAENSNLEPQATEGDCVPYCACLSI